MTLSDREHHVLAELEDELRRDYALRRRHRRMRVRRICALALCLVIPAIGAFAVVWQLPGPLAAALTGLLGVLSGIGLSIVLGAGPAAQVARLCVPIRRWVLG